MISIKKKLLAGIASGIVCTALLVVGCGEEKRNPMSGSAGSVGTPTPLAGAAGAGDAGVLSKVTLTTGADGCEEIIIADPPGEPLPSADGDISDWDTSIGGNDFAGYLYEAGDATKTKLGLLFLRFDCDTNTLCALVLDNPADGPSGNIFWYKGDDDNFFLKTGTVGSKPNDLLLNLSLVGPDSDVSFAYVPNPNGSQGNDQYIGWEGCATLLPGSYSLEAHGMWNSSGDTGSTGKAANSCGFASLESCARLLGDTVWLDEDGDGIQGTDENGVSGVKVNLLDCNGAPLATTTTDVNGEYSFAVVDGSYTVEFVLPDGSTFTDQDAGDNLNDTADSDADPTTGRSDCITIDGADDLTVDAGLVGGVPPTDTFVIGDTVWKDSDGDGVQDGGEAEPGCGGVTVNLLDCTTGEVLQTTATDENGNYSFTVEAGCYVVEFAPEGDCFTNFAGQNLGGDDTLDSDAGPDGKTAPINVTRWIRC
jgi:hypothetical protein